LWGIVASPDGRRLVRADLTDPTSHPDELGRRVAELLLSRGAGELLASVEPAAKPRHPA